MLRFIVDVFQKLGWPPELATPANLSNGSNGQILSEFYCARPTESTYWTDWGGTYDNPTTTNLQVFFETFLQKVADLPTLIATENSFMSSGDFIWTNTEFYPWQYATTSTEVAISFGYSSSVVDPAFPSNDGIEDALGNKQRYPNRLVIPSISNKLSDPISGTALYSSFSFTLINNDGVFDKTKDTNLFNTPTFISKSNVDKPKKEDFKVVRSGLVENLNANETQFIVKSADLFRTLDESVCDTVSLEVYPNAPDNSVGNNIPIAYGEFLKAPLLEVGTNEYLVCSPSYLDTVTAVYNSDGTSLSFSVSSGVITATDAATCDFSGIFDSGIGYIITKEMEDKSNLAYEEGVWDKVEADSYIALSKNINLFYDGSTVKDLVKLCLENDNAFLISKNDGRLTLRQWGQIYQTHMIDNSLITQFPKKTFVDIKYYSSSIKIEYDYNIEADTYDMTYLDDSREDIINEEYNKKTTKTYETRLTSGLDAADLAERLLDRFGGRPEIYSFASGYDTSEVNLLDTIEIDLSINGRELSDTKLFTVTEVNATQDTIKMEESTITYFKKTDGLLAEPGNLSYDGLLSESPGLLASIPAAVEEE